MPLPFSAKSLRSPLSVSPLCSQDAIPTGIILFTKLDEVSANGSGLPVAFTMISLYSVGKFCDAFSECTIVVKVYLKIELMLHSGYLVGQHSLLHQSARSVLQGVVCSPTLCSVICSTGNTARCVTDCQALNVPTAHTISAHCS